MRTREEMDSSLDKIIDADKDPMVVVQVHIRELLLDIRDLLTPQGTGVRDDN